MSEFGFGQSKPKNDLKIEKSVILRKLLEDSNINEKLLLWSQDKIITKFGQKQNG